MTRLAIIGMSVAWFPLWLLYVWLRNRHEAAHPKARLLTAETPNPYHPDSLAYSSFELRRAVDIALAQTLGPVVRCLCRVLASSPLPPNPDNKEQP